jgi:hypothetical protein
MLRIRDATPLEARRVRLTLTDGSVVERDLQDLLQGRVYARVREDDVTFRAVQVQRGTLAWPGDVDLDPNVVIGGGAPPPARSSARPPARLRVPVPA